ncbi:MAG: glycoside hydrolase family 30 beta sandwich domain-containing protein, partial [Acholeplasma sp.]|nr:glycoside hydrolase family 30 beta sandwich domain-containing protein [Acholeplasma sp.]
QLNEEYYAIGHFSKFLDKGARRVEATTTNLNLLISAFINPDGSVVSVIHNKSAYDQYVELTVDGRTANYVIEAKSTVTLDGVQIG